MGAHRGASLTLQAAEKGVRLLGGLLIVAIACAALGAALLALLRAVGPPFP